MTAEKSTPCGFSAVFRCRADVQRRAMGRLAWVACPPRSGPAGMGCLPAALRPRWCGPPGCRTQVPLAWAAFRSHWHGPSARRAQVLLAWAACLPCLALAPWRVRHRLLSGPFSTMAGPCVLNGPFLVAFRARFGLASTKVGRTCKTDHFEWPTWRWRALVCIGTAADGRPASGPRPRLLHGAGHSALMALPTRDNSGIKWQFRPKADAVRLSGFVHEITCLPGRHWHVGRQGACVKLTKKTRCV